MVNLVQRFSITLLIWGSLIAAPCLAAELNSSVDRTNLSINETLTLTVRFDKQVISDPDFTSLNKDFEVLSQQQNNQLSITNGRRTSYTTWSIRLLPKNMGKLLIPSFNLKGAVSNAIELTVTSAPVNQSNTEQPLFIETSIDKNSVYVQEQLILTHKIYTRVNLNSIASDELAIENVSLMKIAESQYQKILNGVNHLVIETKYAIFPQANGTLVIPQLRYSATIPDNRDPYSNSFFSRRGRQVFLRSDKKEIEVKPRPTNIAMSEWLPSKGISLTEKWSRPLNEVRVGEPITRTISILAQGLNAMQLPPLDIPSGTDFKVYPDQPQMSDEQNASGVMGKRTESLAIVPTQAGDVQLPPITLSWWDTNANKLQVTTLAAQTLKVLPAEIIEAMPIASSLPVNVTPESELPFTDKRLLIALIASNLILLLVVMALFFQNYRLRKKYKHAPSLQTEKDHKEQALFKTLRLAANETNYSDFQQALLMWARLFWEDSSLSTIEQVIQLSDSSELATLLTEIDQKAYSPDASKSESMDFTPAFKALIGIRKKRKMAKTDNKNHLQPLYAE